MEVHWFNLVDKEGAEQRRLSPKSLKFGVVLYHVAFQHCGVTICIGPGDPLKALWYRKVSMFPEFEILHTALPLGHTKLHSVKNVIL